MIFFCLAATAVGRADPVSDQKQSTPPRQGMVATVHPLATEAGLAALSRGGNAVDAAVAAALTLGVVDSHNSGIGGGCFILVRTADGKLIAIDGRERAPARATRDMYLKDGRPQPTLSKLGPLAVGVPGALAAYEHAVREFGRIALADHLLLAADLAERGFPLDKNYAARLKTYALLLALNQETRRVLLKKDGTPYRAGERLRQPDLAATYRTIAREGTDWFYGGPFAKRTERWIQQHGGILSAKDLDDYRIRKRQPITNTYRGYTIVGFPPPSSGGIHVAQILNILEHFDLAELYKTDRAAFVHVVAEAMKRAFADRAHWLGDADFAKVPRGLVDKQYAARLAKKINRSTVTKVPGHGTPPRHTSELFGKHTTHIAAADKHGNWVAITTTLNTPFGSKVMVPGTGVLLNNQMDDFSIAPGVPNEYGLIGAEANAIAAGKRPLSSMSPTIVLKDGRPIMTLGAAGGPRIISQVVLAIIARVDLQMPLKEAVAAPRFHHQWSPNTLWLEAGYDATIRQALTTRGHIVKPLSYAGVTQAIEQDPKSGIFVGLSDPRIQGKAVGR